MSEFHIPLVPDHVYHVANRSVGNEKIFIEERNYAFFLNKCVDHITPIADIFSYSLLPNHFHLIVDIKSLEVIEEYYSRVKKTKILEGDQVCDFIMERFANLLNSYCKSFNKTYRRKGALFVDYLKREEVEDGLQFLETAVYIHEDPVRHGHCKKLTDWKWTSYNFDFFNQLQNVINKFGGIKMFSEYHEKRVGKRNYEIMEIE